VSLEANKTVARRFTEEHHQAAYVAVHDQLVAPDARIHFYVPGTPDPLDREGHKQLVAMFRAAMPDIRSTVEDIAAEGDRVVVRWSGSGTQTGELMGIPPRGVHVMATGIFIFRIVDGRIVEFWENLDMLGVLQQLGALPAPAPATA
jgi:predicted ester cyclase